MAVRKSGPVKPPVIDLKAREAEKAASTAEGKAEEVAAETVVPESVAPEAAPSEETARPAPPPPPRPPARLAMPWSAISIATAGGALLGAGLVYALGNWLPLPNKVPVIADPAVRLDAQDTSLADLTGRLAAIEEQAKRTQVSLDATIAQMDSGLGEMRQSIAAVPAAEPVDLTPIETQLKSLEDRVTAIGAGASGADATALAETIGTIESDIAGLKQQLSEGATTGTSLDSSIAELRQQVAALQTAVATANQTISGTDVGPAIRLPLVVSGLESAITNGRPFAAELASIKVLLPDLAIPEPIAASAESGLPRPDSVAARLSAAVPEILAGRAAQSTGDLGQDAVEWMKGLLALRPTGELEGDSPEAIVSRLEGAAGRQDFTAAAQLLAALPPAMQAGAGTAGADVVKLAAADGFLTELRARALAPTTEATP